MQLTAREDIAAPIEEVFAVLSDFPRVEAAAGRRGADLRRLDDRSEPGPGMAWAAEFTLQGARRAVETELVAFEPPQQIRLQSRSGGLQAASAIELQLLAPRLTRLAISIDLASKTIGARVLLQTLRLAHHRLADQLETAVARLAREIEAGRFRQG
ncbi:SRPBCC family protein [Rhodovulum sp. BSW8]|uniref:Polyketide cyclase/dehydrase/lipid transport protein n=1 Tax=Rhodovulum visakhapatnamense TaxID=364297 RepID=A0A4R8FE69_9RHOB|nr:MULTISPECIES: SRPBCC family protein [Rhodovulum]RBO53755.1 SRPBCC family protein [Rhodovulum sp. BSW8]TDX24154.1 polyketide cyclase/dehydrase/lipid transport protein [Rhodovulum visakhapatnamense]